MARNPITPVGSRYGAPMGRRAGVAAPDHGEGRVYLRRVRLNSGGYDAGGAYWGHGQPLYTAFTDSNVTFLRALSRDDAKAQLREDYGDKLEFWR